MFKIKLKLRFSVEIEIEMSGEIPFTVNENEECLLWNLCPYVQRKWLDQRIAICPSEVNL